MGCEGDTLRGDVGACIAFHRLRGVARSGAGPSTDVRSSPDRGPRCTQAGGIDGRTTLISSANLTDRALTGNLEVGVVLRDERVVVRIVQHFTEPMQPAILETIH